MTENVYGELKRFLCLRDMRNHLPATKIIVATAILHNLLKLWNDEVPPELGFIRERNELSINVVEEDLVVRVEDGADIEKSSWTATLFEACRKHATSNPLGGKATTSSRRRYQFYIVLY
jgi:hypothetical protein